MGAAEAFRGTSAVDQRPAGRTQRRSSLLIGLVALIAFVPALLFVALRSAMPSEPAWISADSWDMTGATVDRQSALKLDGVPARRTDMHGKYEQTKTWLTVIVAVKGGDRVYVLEYATEHAPSATDRQRLDTMLATFSFK